MSEIKHDYWSNKVTSKEVHDSHQKQVSGTPADPDPECGDSGDPTMLELLVFAGRGWALLGIDDTLFRCRSSDFICV